MKNTEYGPSGRRINVYRILKRILGTLDDIRTGIERNMVVKIYRVKKMNVSEGFV